MKLLNLKMKKVIICLLSLVLLCSIGVFCHYELIDARADGLSIEMCDGASIKYNDAEHNGMRFIAKVNNYDSTNTNISFGMIIIPDSYLELEGIKNVSNPDYISVLTEKGKSILNIENMTPYYNESDENYYLKGVISNVAYSNLNRAFYGIAYYKVGDTYTYASIDETNNARSFSTIVEEFIKDTDNFDDLKDEYKQVIYEFKYKAINSKNGINESDVKAYDSTNTTKELAIYDEIKGTNTLASFNNDNYLTTLSKPTHDWSADITKSFDSTTFTGRNVLKLQISSSGEPVDEKYDASYGALNISFLNAITVTENTVLTFNLYCENSNLFYIGKGLAQNQVYSDLGVVGKWVTNAVKATSLGYSVGDKISSINIYLANLSSNNKANQQTSTYYIDEIAFSESLTAESAELNVYGNGYLAKFDSIYSVVDKSGVSFYDDGEVTGVVYNHTSGNIVTVPFTQSHTVRDGDILKVRYKFVNHTGSQFLKKDGNLQGVGRYDSAFTVVSFSLQNDLGYSVGDSISNIQIKNLASNLDSQDYVVFDYIMVENSTYEKEQKRLALKDNLSGTELANYNSEDYSSFLVKPGVSSSTNSAYNFAGNNYTSKTISGGCAVVSSSSTYYACAGFEFIKSVTVTADLVFNIRINSGSGELRVAKLGADSIGTAVSGVVKGSMTTVSVLATDIGFEVGETANGLDLYFGVSSGTNYIDYISTSSLGANELANYNDNEALSTLQLAGVKSATDNNYYTHGYYNTTKTIDTTNGYAVITSSTKYYACAGFRFIRSVTVTEELVINIRINSGSGSLSVAKLGANSTGTTVTGAVKGSFATVSFYATDVGFTIGETISGLDLYFGANSGEYNYIDYISYSNIDRYALNKELTGNQVANFDDNGYLSYISAGTIADGIWTATSSYDWRVATVLKQNIGDGYQYNTIPLTTTGKEGYAVVRIKTSATRVRFYNDEATRASTPSGSNDLIHSTASDWVANSTGDWQILIFPLKQIGYSEGDVFNKLSYAVWGNSTQVLIDYIEYVELASGLANKTEALTEYTKDILDKELTNYQVANYNNSQYSALVSAGTIADGVWTASSNYDWRVATLAKTNTIVSTATGKEGYAVVRIKTSATSVRFYKAEATRATAPTGNKTFIGGSTNWSITSTGDWQVLIFPLTQIGYSEGDVFNKLSYAVWGNSTQVLIDYIEYVELTSGLANKTSALTEYYKLKLPTELTGNQVANFDNVGYTSIMSGISIVADGDLSVMQANIGSGVNLNVKFAKTVTVTATSTITIKIKSASIVALVPNSGSNKSLLSANGYTSYTYNLVSDLGYTEGTELSQITFKNNNGSKITIYIDEILVG